MASLKAIDSIVAAVQSWIARDCQKNHEKILLQNLQRDTRRQEWEQHLVRVELDTAAVMKAIKAGASRREPTQSTSEHASEASSMLFFFVYVVIVLQLVAHPSSD